MAVTNTLACYEMAIITAVKNFKVQAALCKARVYFLITPSFKSPYLHVFLLIIIRIYLCHFQGIIGHHTFFPLWIRHRHFWSFGALQLDQKEGGLKCLEADEDRDRQQE